MIGYLTQLDNWVAENRNVLEQHGAVKYGKSPGDRPKLSAYLVVNFDDAEVELLLWDSGEAEFNRGSFREPVLEHLDLDSNDALADLLDRFRRAVVSGGN